MSLEGSSPTGLASIGTAQGGTPGVPGGATLVHQGTAIAVDNTDPLNPVVTNTGVRSFNGNSLAVLYYPTVRVATVAALGALTATVAAGFDYGCLAWVDSLQALWVLQPGAFTIDGITLINNASRAGSQWYRVPLSSSYWLNTYIANTVHVDPQNGAASDEATGLAGAPLKTLTELSRRIGRSIIPSGSTVNAVLDSDCLTTDKPVWTHESAQGTSANDGFVLTGTLTSVYTGTITTANNLTDLTHGYAQEISIVDNGIPVSYTASGLIGTGLIAQRTNGTNLWFYLIKDNGSKTARITRACTGSSSAPTQSTLANGDSYTVWRLPKIYDQQFQITTANRGAHNVFSLVDDHATTNSSSQAGVPMHEIVKDRVTTATAQNFVNGTWSNCAWWASATFTGQGLHYFAASAAFIANNGLISLQNACAMRANGDMVYQGCAMFLGSGAHGLNNTSFTFYDVGAGTGATACFSLLNFVGNGIGFICGLNNSLPIVKVGASAGCNYGTAQVFQDGMTSSSPNILVGASTGTFASLPLVDAANLSIMARQV